MSEASVSVEPESTKKKNNVDTDSDKKKNTNNNNLDTDPEISEKKILKKKKNIDSDPEVSKKNIDTDPEVSDKKKKNIDIDTDPEVSNMKKNNNIDTDPDVLEKKKNIDTDADVSDKKKKKKKKRKREAEAEADPVTDISGTKMKKKKIKTDESSKVTVRVNNLPSEISESHLHEFFESAGKIVGIRSVVYAHLEFEYEEAALKGLKLDQQELLGRPVNVENDARPGHTLIVKGFDTSLGVDNLRKALQRHFCQCGEIVYITFPKGNDGSLKGWAYMEFFERKASRKAIGLNQSELDGFILMVKEPTDESGGKRSGWGESSNTRGWYCGGRRGGGRGGRESHGLENENRGAVGGGRRGGRFGGWESSSMGGYGGGRHGGGQGRRGHVRF